MPIANPVINGSAAGATPAAGTPADGYPGGGGSTMARSTGVQAPFTGEHNTAAHVGALVLVALGVIILLNVAGFRFVVDAGVAAGR
jgi:hypothetical protein